MFSVHTTPEESNNATITSHFGFVFEETRVEKSRDYRDVIVFKKLVIVFKMFSVHKSRKSRRCQIPLV